MTLSPAMSHSRCSELLGPLVRGDLAPAEGAAVEAHLSGCPDCSRELMTVRSLLEAPRAAMDDLERARLRGRIAGGLRQMTRGEGGEGKVRPPRSGDGAPISPRPASSKWVRSGAWLGAAAATLILFAGAAAYLGSEGFVAGGSDQGGATSQSAESAGERAGAGAPRPNLAEDESNVSQRARGPLVARGRTELTERSLAALGRTAPPFRSFAGVYSSGDVSRLQGRFGDALAAGLGNALVRPCLAQAIGTRPEALPAYGATGMLDGRRVLVLGFFIPGSDARGGRFEVRWWDAGTLGPGATCPQPLGSARGAI
ncbi:MAG: zf-HC2 domain-containing protein [Actinomycetota bacterium]|nr:zf-HC2 domain-containing protein [Actinomycetota bacterium]